VGNSSALLNEEFDMSKLIASFALAMCLMTPAVSTLRAQDHPNPHVWSDGENDSWHRYLKEKHIKDHEWTKANKREQANYWKWRDQHRDAH
jgi:hypothetical protein